MNATKYLDLLAENVGGSHSALLDVALDGLESVDDRIRLLLCRNSLISSQLSVAVSPRQIASAKRIHAREVVRAHSVAFASYLTSGLGNAQRTAREHG